MTIVFEFRLCIIRQPGRVYEDPRRHAKDPVPRNLAQVVPGGFLAARLAARFDH